jgi:ribose transport system permease protein
VPWQPRTYVRPVEVAVPFILVGIALLVGAWVSPGFLSSNHLSSMSQTAAYVGIIALGQTLVLLLGGIDLSIPYAINLAAVLIAGFQYDGMSGTTDFALVMLIGAGIGLANGLGIALLDISPLVMTLGMNSILQGVTLIYTHGSAVGQAPPFVTKLSTAWWGSVPYVAVLWIILTVVVTLVLAFTTFGRSIYAVGSNRRASELCGLGVRRTTVLAYMLSGLAAALGGALLVGYSGQAYLGMGDAYLLPAIAVVVIGGTSIFGGKGSYVQTAAGALLITVITSILVTVDVDQSGQDILYGAIILVMAFFNQVAISQGAAPLRSLGRGLGAFRGWLQPAMTREEAAAARNGSAPPAPTNPREKERA